MLIEKLDNSCEGRIDGQLTRVMERVKFAGESEDDLQNRIEELQEEILGAELDHFDGRENVSYGEIAEYQAQSTPEREELDSLNDRINNGEHWEGFNDSLLSIEKKTTFKVLMSWGGPSDWFEVQCSGEAHNWEIDSIVYHFADWFDHAERRLTGDEFDQVRDLLQPLIEYQE